MFRRLSLSLFLVAVLARVAGAWENRPVGVIPSPSKDGSSNNSEQWQHQIKEVLASSQEALALPERKYLKCDWCKTQPLRQAVGEEGWGSRRPPPPLLGQGDSCHIPSHVEEEEEEEESFPSCAFCQPQRVTSVLAELECPGLDPPFRLTKLQKVKQGRCVSVNLSDWDKQRASPRAQAALHAPPPRGLAATAAAPPCPPSPLTRCLVSPPPQRQARLLGLTVSLSTTWTHRKWSFADVSLTDPGPTRASGTGLWIRPEGKGWKTSSTPHLAIGGDLAGDALPLRQRCFHPVEKRAFPWPPPTLRPAPSRVQRRAKDAALC
uniref:DAN domain-containing protein n=1 Tax=Prolemur simus TaxID=1328070 RepID=A0A8C8YTV5_PROSS